jgi:hypothetical protein
MTPTNDILDKLRSSIARLEYSAEQCHKEALRASFLVDFLEKATSDEATLDLR